MPNYKLTLEYLGSAFQGWHPQKHEDSVSQELLKTLNIILPEPVSAVYASGRTDSGVHARGQVVNFHYPENLNPHSLLLGVSSILRGRLSVVNVELVPDDFHARFSVVSKTYVYEILNRKAPPVLQSGFVWHIPFKLDILRMRDEASSLIGTHDFSSFRAGNCGARDPQKTINTIEIIEEHGVLKVSINASGFLKQMVRNIIGTLVEFGLHNPRFENLSMQDILESRDRKIAGRTAPAEGLYLEKVYY